MGDGGEVARGNECNPALASATRSEESPADIADRAPLDVSTTESGYRFFDDQSQMTDLLVLWTARLSAGLSLDG